MALYTLLPCILPVPPTYRTLRRVHAPETPTGKATKPGACHMQAPAHNKKMSREHTKTHRPAKLWPSGLGLPAVAAYFRSQTRELTSWMMDFHGPHAPTHQRYVPDDCIPRIPINPTASTMELSSQTMGFCEFHALGDGIHITPLHSASEASMENAFSSKGGRFLKSKIDFSGPSRGAISFSGPSRGAKLYDSMGSQVWVHGHVHSSSVWRPKKQDPQGSPPTDNSRAPPTLGAD